MRKNERAFFTLKKGGILVGAIFFMAFSCAPGDPQFTAETPAGFWQGLWHGMIAAVTFVISLFSDSVKIYEVNNNGGWYDFGFLFGVTMVWGSSSGGAMKAKARRGRGDEAEAAKWEARFEEMCQEWATEENSQEWAEISRKVEKKLKRKLKQWAEEED